MLETKIKERESMIAANVEKIAEVLKYGQKVIDDLREELMSVFNIDEKYKFVLANESTLKVEFETGEFWNNGTPIRTSIDFKYEELENKESFTINPYTAGSFDPTGKSYLIDYYSLVGLFCSNKDVTNAIKRIMREIYCKVTQIREVNYFIRAELANLKNERPTENKFDSIKNEYKKHEYVLIQTNVEMPIAPYFIYKKKPVDILGYGTYMECYDNFFTNYKDTENKFEIVESSKIKF